MRRPGHSRARKGRTPKQGSVYRAGNSGLMYAAWAVATVGVLASGVVELALDAPTEDAWAIAGASFLIVVAALYVVAVWRSYSSCLVVNARGVEVRNMIRRRRIPWSEVSEFTWEPHAYYHRVAVVHLRDGRRISAYGIRSLKSLVSAEGPGQSEVNMLNAELSRARARAKAARRGKAQAEAPSAPSASV